jgi:hypothetical protein
MKGIHTTSRVQGSKLPPTIIVEVSELPYVLEVKQVTAIYMEMMRRFGGHVSNGTDGSVLHIEFSDFCSMSADQLMCCVHETLLDLLTNGNRQSVATDPAYEFTYYVVARCAVRTLSGELRNHVVNDGATGMFARSDNQGVETVTATIAALAG